MVIEARFSLHSSNITYSTGDSLVLTPENPPAIVKALLTRLDFPPMALITLTTPDGDACDPATTLSHLLWPCTVQCAFQRRLDITGVPKKSLLRVLAEHCSSREDADALKFLTTRTGRDAYAKYIDAGRPGLLDILNAFPTCCPPLAALLDALPPLPPRFYSITTSPLAHPEECAVAFSVVRQASGFSSRGGIATSWLKAMCAE